LNKKKLIKIFCIKGCKITVGWFSIFFWAKIKFFALFKQLPQILFLVIERIFWRSDFDQYFQPEEGFPFELSYSFLSSSAPRKFKNLGTDAFIASKLYQILIW